MVLFLPANGLGKSSTQLSLRHESRQLVGYPLSNWSNGVQWVAGSNPAVPIGTTYASRLNGPYLFDFLLPPVRCDARVLCAPRPGRRGGLAKPALSCVQSDLHRRATAPRERPLRARLRTRMHGTSWYRGATADDGRSLSFARDRGIAWQRSAELAGGLRGHSSSRLPRAETTPRNRAVSQLRRRDPATPHLL